MISVLPRPNFDEPDNVVFPLESFPGKNRDELPSQDNDNSIHQKDQ